MPSKGPLRSAIYVPPLDILARSASARWRAAFVVEPAPRSDDVVAGGDAGALRQRVVGYGLQREHVDRAYVDCAVCWTQTAIWRLGGSANAGMISWAKRRRDAGPPALLSSTYSAPTSRSAWSLTAISSGVP
jgi:hypothetical protein